METMSWYWHFLLMITLVRRLNFRESGLLPACTQAGSLCYINLPGVWNDVGKSPAGMALRDRSAVRKTM
jgi:hypothetical protein